jgi:uncharacterized membrane protein
MSVSGSKALMTIAAYPDLATAEEDWERLETAGEGLAVYIADAALVSKDAAGEVQTWHRQTHHGWGKGAVAGAFLGVLFPPSLIATAAAGAGAGALTARVNRSLERGDVAALGEAMDKGSVSIAVVSDGVDASALRTALRNAIVVESREGKVSAADLQSALQTDG